MTKKEANKLFTQMVKEVRPFINGESISFTSLGIHMVNEKEIPEDFKKSDVGKWATKRFVDNPNNGITLFYK